MNTNTNTFRLFSLYSKWLTDGSVLELHSCMISELNFGNSAWHDKQKISIENQRTIIDLIYDQKLKGLYNSVSQILARRKDMLIYDWIKQLSINPNQSRISRFLMRV